MPTAKLVYKVLDSKTALRYILLMNTKAKLNGSKLKATFYLHEALIKDIKQYALDHDMRYSDVVEAALKCLFEA